MRVSLILVAVVTVALTGMFAVGTWSTAPELAADDGSGPVDLTKGATNAADAAGTGVEPSDAVVTGLLDDFNRPKGPIGPSWTVQAGGFSVVSNAAQGGPLALATWNSGGSTAVEADIEANGTGLQYTGLVLNYADINNNLFFKVQEQTGDGLFETAACYYGNNGSGGPSWGLEFYDLTSPFRTAHMRVELTGADALITFSNIDGGVGVQSYLCTSTYYLKSA